MKIELERVEKRFGHTRGLKGITLSFNEGERVLVVGRNGAGKSTLLKILCGLISPERGTIRWWHEGESSPPRHVAYTCHDPLVYDALTVDENIRLFAKMIGADISVDSLLKEWELSPCRYREVRALSQGERSRVGFCRAFLGAPQFVILDEPTASLDDISTRSLLVKLTSLSSLSIVATHDPGRFSEWATRTLSLDEGTVQDDRANPGKNTGGVR